MRKLLFFFLILTSASVYSKESDPGGWQKAKWGMTDAQVQKSFGGAAPTETEIGTFKYTVSYDYDANGKLQRVTLQATTKGGNSVLFNEVFDKLVAKYGPNTTGGRVSSRRRGRAGWQFRKSQIMLILADAPENDKMITDIFTIEYRKAGLVEPGAENL